ncbi:MAG TPA: hypothetical protein VKA21_05760 [Candidatus Binatia bacterium]|nr:hypothetical protein [Candidatus Binatia bacterium]
MRALAVIAVLAVAAAGRAETGAFTRFFGGGSSRTDCMLVVDVAGATGARTARCTDGDPACDADATVNGTCTLGVRLCLDATDAALPRCASDVVTEAEASVPALEQALAALAMPVSAPETCTDEVTVAVPRPGRRGRLRLSALARMASGHADRDRVALVCRRPAPAPTAAFATLQQRIFTPSCAMFSCHGDANAGGLGLGAGIAYADLVGVPAANTAANAAGLLRVAPGDPDRSFLLRKLEGRLAVGEGDPMPQVGTRLPASSIDLIRRWILAGAPAE